MAKTGVNTWWVALGAITVVIGVLFSLLMPLGVLDPAGFQHANDSDPFGVPPSRVSFGALAALGVVVASGGFVAILRAVRQ